MPEDKLAQRLDSLLSTVSTNLDTAPDAEVDAPPPFAGGVPLSHILELPLADTPEEFRLPPPSEEEEAALARIQSSLFSGFSIAELGSLSGSSKDPDSSVKLTAPMFMAPDGSLGGSSKSKSLVYSTEIPITYENDITPGINHVPSGIYYFRSEALFYSVKGKKGGDCACSDKGVPASSLGLGSGSLSSSVDSLTQPVAYVVAALNALGTVVGAPKEPCFLCLVAHLPFSGLYCVRVSDVTLYHPCLDASLQKVLKIRNNNIYWFCSQSLLLESKPVLACVCNSDTAVVPVCKTLSSILSDALHVFLPPTVNSVDRSQLREEVDRLTALDEQKQQSLALISSILSKYSKE